MDRVRGRKEIVARLERDRFIVRFAPVTNCELAAFLATLPRALPTDERNARIRTWIAASGDPVVRCPCGRSVVAWTYEGRSGEWRMCVTCHPDARPYFDDGRGWRGAIRTGPCWCGRLQTSGEAIVDLPRRLMLCRACGADEHAAPPAAPDRVVPRSA